MGNNGKTPPRGTPTPPSEAYQAVRKALRSGDLTPPESSICAFCGEKTRLVAYHEDFSAPLKVVWYCYRCVWWKTRGVETPPPREGTPPPPLKRPPGVRIGLCAAEPWGHPCGQIPEEGKRFCFRHQFWRAEGTGEEE